MTVPPRLEKFFIFAVREASVFPQNGGQIQGPPYTPHYDSAIIYAKFLGGPSIFSQDAQRDARNLH